VGSGLILLVIVGAWLAVLVPMALRSHDSSTSLSSVERFNDAMRVLSRREQQGRGAARTFVLPPRPRDAAGVREPVPVFVRRRRVLLGLIGLALVLLVATVLLRSAWALAGHVLVDALVMAYVAHLRKQAILRAERSVRAAGDGPVRPRRPRAQPMRIAGIPDQMPRRPAALAAPLPVPAARYEDPLPLSPTATWDAPQFPVPTYVTAPVAPPRPTRVVDLTQPGKWSEGLETEDAGLSILDDRDELDDILDRQRASGDW
jgi:hypothetical protein